MSPTTYYMNSTPQFLKYVPNMGNNNEGWSIDQVDVFQGWNCQNQPAGHKMLRERFFPHIRLGHNWVHFPFGKNNKETNFLVFEAWNLIFQMAYLNWR